MFIATTEEEGGGGVSWGKYQSLPLGKSLA